MASSSSGVPSYSNDGDESTRPDEDSATMIMGVSPSRNDKEKANAGRDSSKYMVFSLSDKAKRRRRKQAALGVAKRRNHLTPSIDQGKESNSTQRPHPHQQYKGRSKSPSPGPRSRPHADEQKMRQVQLPQQVELPQAPALHQNQFLATVLSKRNEEIQALKDQLGRLQKTKQKSTLVQLRNAEEELLLLRAEHQMREKYIQTLEGEKKGIAEENSQMKEELASLKEEKDTEENIILVTDKSEALEKTLAHQREDMKRVKNETEIERNKNKEAGEEIEQLKEALAAADQEQGLLRVTLGSKSATIDKLTKSLTEEKSINVHLRADLEEVSSSEEKLHKKVEEMNTLVASLDKQRAIDAGIKAENKFLIDNLAEENKTLKHKLEKAAAEIRMTIPKQKKHIESLSFSNRNYINEKISLENEKNDLLLRIGELGALEKEVGEQGTEAAPLFVFVFIVSALSICPSWY